MEMICWTRALTASLCRRPLLLWIHPHHERPAIVTDHEHAKLLCEWGLFLISFLNKYISPFHADPDDKNLEELDPDDHQKFHINVPMVMQWLTGQRHKPILPSEKAHFKINVAFKHHCSDKMPGHRICYPLVSACTNTVTFPVAHMTTCNEFRNVLTTAMRMGADFGRV